VNEHVTNQETARGLGWFKALRASPIVRLVLGLCLFAAAYAAINAFMLTHSVLYRWAVADYWTAAWHFGCLAAQALALLMALTFLSTRWAVLLLMLVFFSAWLNLGYGMILNEIIDAPHISWMLGETGQASATSQEFSGQIISALLIALGSIGVLLASRVVLRSQVAHYRNKPLIGCAALLAPVLLLDPFSTGPVGAERNAFIYTAHVLTAPGPPQRAAVLVEPKSPPAAEKIVWLIDESVSKKAFDALVLPSAMSLNPINFAAVHAFSNCSAPANLALRSGVDVARATDTMDLRTTPSIWRYGHKAGYRTTLIDGQTSGPTQNMILPPERALIDEFVPASHGLKTDLAIAQRVNEMMKRPGRDFIYVVLRGVHYQYRDHYPKGLTPETSPDIVKYETAIRYSRDRFFATLMAAVDRERVAVFYTSDHGQNVTPGALPHCSVVPPAQEFDVPLLALLPPSSAGPYTNAVPGRRSHSQIFSTSLALMGYPRAHADGYDHDLTRPSKRIVWFGRNVVPLRKGAPIELHIAQ
jgi:hypothetical protein